MSDTRIEGKLHRMLELLAEGASTNDLAKKMGYSEGTVRVYLHNLYRALGVKNRTEAVLWHLRKSGEPAAVPAPARSLSEETFGEVALREGLLCTLGVMESFLGPHGRVWEVGQRIKGKAIDPAQSHLQSQSRRLWRALLAGEFATGKETYDRNPDLEPGGPALLVLALLLQLGGYSAGDRLLARIRRRKSESDLSAREMELLRSVELSLAGDPEGLSILNRLASASAPMVRQLACVALFHLHRGGEEIARARKAADGLWADAEESRRQLEALGVRPLAVATALPVSRGSLSTRKTEAPVR